MESVGNIIDVCFAAGANTLNGISFSASDTEEAKTDAMQKAAVKTTGLTNRGLVNRTGLRVLNKTHMPACLIEYGFISNPKEERTMYANTARYGKELYQALVNYMKAEGKIK